MLRRALLFSVALAALLALSVVVVGYRHAPESAKGVATEAASILGVNLLAFAGPTRSGNYLTGSESFHWERRINGEAVELVSYLPGEERLCWQQRDSDRWKDNGCINTRQYQY